MTQIILNSEQAAILSSATERVCVCFPDGVVAGWLKRDITPKEPIFTPAEIAATLYQGLGFDPHRELPGPQNRPLPLADFNVQPIKELF